MKATLILFVFCAAFFAVNGLSVASEEPEQAASVWYNPLSYEYRLCNLKCKVTCMEQGYWNGFCKMKECMCVGPMGPMGPTGFIRPAVPVPPRVNPSPAVY